MKESELSIWGWGYRDKMPSEKERRTQKNLLEGMLGFPELQIHTPADISEIDIPNPSVSPPSTLANYMYSDTETRAHHTYGKSYRDLVRGFHGDYTNAPDIVAKPRDEKEVTEVLEWCSDNDIAVIPFGGGTSVVAGVEPDFRGDYNGCVSLNLRELDQVREIDEESWSAYIEGGALGPVLQSQLKQDGFQLRHYPQSYEFSTLGGWIATRSGGHFATRYTHIDDFVESVRVATPSGVMETRRLPGSGAGPDPNRLFIGSEGVLGVITGAWMRVQRAPRHRSKASVLFDDYWDAVDATREIVQSRLYPSNLRLLDSTEAMINQVHMGGEHVLLVGFESTHHGTGDRMDKAVEIVEEYGGEISSMEEGSGGKTESDEGGSWRNQFFEAPYLFNSLVSMSVLVDTFETAVTWSGFRGLHRDIKEEVGGLLEDMCGAGVVSSRFTHVYPDGPAPYYTVIAPTKMGEELNHWRKIKEKAGEILMRHNATITHHHAVGRVHRPWYEQEVPRAIRDAFWAVKKEFDPSCVMNPGALLGERIDEKGGSQ